MGRPAASGGGIGIKRKGNAGGMNTTTLIIIILIVVLLTGGIGYGRRGR